MQRSYQVRDVIKSYHGYCGACTHCGNKATKEALFDEDGIIVVEKYCDDCIEPQKFSQLQDWYRKFSNSS